MSVIQNQTVAKSWRKGAPPSVGWWPTRMRHHRTWIWSGFLRYWDGKRWSAAVAEWRTAEEAAKKARLKSYHSESIEWRERPASWPEASRT